MVFAAIDIGSNAMRLLFCRVYTVDGKPHFSKEELIRMPIRLGEDVFLHGTISDAKADRLITALKGFAELIKAYGVEAHRAVATSAMRDAKNGAEIIARVKAEAGLIVEIIDGKNEAALVFSNHIEELLNPKHAYLYIDVGGGSTELTLYYDNKVIAAKSFNIGTVRMLLEKVEKDEWDEMKSWLKRNTVGIHPLSAIGSGGNINKIFKMSGKKETKHLSYDKVKNIYDMLCSYTYQERVERLDLKPDRADVIIPAAKIFLTVMKNADIEKVFVPQVGLSDGLVHQMYDTFKKAKTTVKS
ncbi:Ppx/GppA phosphatase family protein [Aurantibacillus circumpalustris]|uniref:Ppx/GppA phosphatase family protein n=1 Tax=Aurantibacillus circumpalustris TaxID=3036359 RepID=UPI00295B8597|nr:exopolyphosphatase [Aurantibacillus circumpalustris]